MIEIGKIGAATRRIYIVDDDDDVRASLQDLISILPNTNTWGFRTGPDFLQRAEELEPGVVLLDYSMPDMNGLEVLDKLKAWGPKFVSIVLTAHGQISLAVSAVKAGALEFLEKPYEHDDLLRALTMAFERLGEASAEAAKMEDARKRLERLSAREREVLAGLMQGRANKVIAHDLSLSPRTVEIYRARLMEKLVVSSLSETIRLVFVAGVNPDSEPGERWSVLTPSTTAKAGSPGSGFNKPPEQAVFPDATSWSRSERKR